MTLLTMIPFAIIIVILDFMGWHYETLNND